MKIVGNSHYQKEANALLILNLLRRYPCSRVQIAHELGLQNSTVTYSVGRLLEHGSIMELPADKESVSNGKVGRKPNLLAINPNFGKVVGIEMMSGLYRIFISDICGVSTFKAECRYRNNKVSGNPDRFRELVKEVVEQARKLCEDIPLLGVCIAVPGIVLEGNTCIQECWTHGLDEEQFALFLADFPVPVFFENDANCCALKYLFNNDDPNDSFFYLQSRKHRPEAVPEGIPTIGLGLGIVVNGALLRGCSSRAGEYRSSMLMGTDRPGQVPLNERETALLETDETIRRRLIREVFSDLFCTVSIFDPRSLYVGGFLASLPYRETIERVFDQELNDFWLRSRWEGEMFMIHDTLFDPSEGAADAVLDLLYRVPQVGNSASDSWNWDALLSGHT